MQKKQKQEKPKPPERTPEENRLRIEVLTETLVRLEHLKTRRNAELKEFELLFVNKTLKDEFSLMGSAKQKQTSCKRMLNATLLMECKIRARCVFQLRIREAAMREKLAHVQSLVETAAKVTEDATDPVQ